MKIQHLLAASFALSLACSEQELHHFSTPEKSGDASITGRICDVAAETWLQGAMVYTHILDEDSGDLLDTRTTTTDQEGRFKLETLIADRTYTVYVQKGSEMVDLFDIHISVEQKDVVLQEPQCGGAEIDQVAVVTGDYDAFSEVLDALGITNYAEINGQTGEELVQFLTSGQMADFDAVFFAGGHIEEDVFYDSDGSGGDEVNDVILALQDYVAGGGVVYASDWSYDVVERAWPDEISFLGDDSAADVAQKGEPEDVQCDITDDGLAEAVGTSEMELHYDLDAWPIAEDVGDDVVVYQTADVTAREGFDTWTVEDSPLLVSFQKGDGRVVFSSWRQSANLDDEGLDVVRYMIAF